MLPYPALVEVSPAWHVLPRGKTMMSRVLGVVDRVEVGGAEEVAMVGVLPVAIDPIVATSSTSMVATRSIPPVATPPKAAEAAVVVAPPTPAARPIPTPPIV